jgi:hypothetical protein
MALDISRLKNGLRRRWVHSQNNRHTVALAKAVAERSKPTGQAVVIFNASTRLDGMSLNAGFSLSVAWSLRLQGVPVVHFVCSAGLNPCVLGTQRNDPAAEPPCAACMAQSKVLYTGADVRQFQYRPDESLRSALQKCNLADCMAFEWQALPRQTMPWQAMPLGELVLPSVRWILRRHHLVEDEQTLQLYRQYILSAWSLACQFGSLLSEVKPRAVLVFNGMFYPEATARWVARQHGLNAISHEVGLRPFTGFFTTGDATAYPIDIPDSFELNTEQNERLDGYLEQRFQGNFSMAGVRFWPEIKKLAPEFLERAAKFKQIVPVFTNVIFDTSQGHANVVFSHMFAWLDAVLEVIRRNSDTLFVIRAHPDEGRPGKESLESVADWVRKTQADRLSNVLFVDANQYFSSYELIQRSKFVMVYNSTIGLEASLMGAPVLCAGKARFTQLETVYFPGTPEDYVRQAQEFLDCEKITVPAEFERNARRFLYYQLYKSSLPFDGVLGEDGVWKGFTAFKSVDLDALTPAHSETLSVVTQGILQATEFLLDA